MCVYLQKNNFFWRDFFCFWSLSCSGFWQEHLSWQSSRQWRQVGIHDTHLHTEPPLPYREFLCLTGEGVDPILFHCLLTGKTHEYNLFCTFYYGVINQFPVGNPHRRGTSHSLSSERRTYTHFFLFPISWQREVDNAKEVWLTVVKEQIQVFYLMNSDEYLRLHTLTEATNDKERFFVCQ